MTTIALVNKEKLRKFTIRPCSLLTRELIEDFKDRIEETLINFKAYHSINAEEELTKLLFNELMKAQRLAEAKRIAAKSIVKRF